METEPNERHFLPVWNEMSDDDEAYFSEKRERPDFAFLPSSTPLCSSKSLDLAPMRGCGGVGLIRTKLVKVTSNKE